MEASFVLSLLESLTFSIKKKSTLNMNFFRARLKLGFNPDHMPIWEWTCEGDNSEKSQIVRMENFTSQIEKASEKPCHIVILGDANLCSQKLEKIKQVLF